MILINTNNIYHIIPNATYKQNEVAAYHYIIHTDIFRQTILPSQYILLNIKNIITRLYI